jgi:glycosyltransferase involved in cell wall biosynthesis
MKHTLSVVISAYNEEAKIGNCLDSIPFADEYIVIDNTSSDKTAIVAKKHGAIVYTRPNQLMLNINKNYGFEKATSEWILNLDADEELTPELGKEIKVLLEKPSEELHHGYWISRRNMIFGKWIQHGVWWPDKQLRLFAKQYGKFLCKHIHEYIEVDGTTADLIHPYIHHNYDSVAQYLTKLERCTTSEALALEESAYQLTWQDAIRFPLSDFLKLYFAQRGYKDGLHGLVLALFQAFYSFTVFAKLWEIQKFPDKTMTLGAIKEEIQQGSKDVSYWVTSSEIHTASNIFTKIFLKIKRRMHV